jgi:hypothetical protein
MHQTKSVKPYRTLVLGCAMGITSRTLRPTPRRFLRRKLPRALASKTVKLTVLTSTVRRGNLAGTLSASELPPETLFPFLGSIPANRIAIWLYKDDQHKVPRGQLGMTIRNQTRLGLSDSNLDITLALPQCFSFPIRVPPASDLPAGASIRVPVSTYRDFRRTWHTVRVYALLTTEAGLAAPVRLHPRPLTGSYILAPMLVRTLCGLREGETIQLSLLPNLAAWRQASWFTGRVFARKPDRRALVLIGLLLGALLIIMRLVDYLLEMILRLAFRSQPLTFRVIQANPGDDDLRDTIRLHPAAFSALALTPGQQVVLNWAGKRMAVRALEDPSPVDIPASSEVLRSVGLRLDTGLLPEGFPAHLVTRLPAPLRQGLNIPPGTVIEIRRRLRPAVVSQLNQLTIPVAGLILAAAAFPEVRGWPLVAGTVAAMALGLAPLRMPRPPRGYWP